MNHAIHSSRPAGVERAAPEPGGQPRGLSDPTSPVATSRRRHEIVKSLSSWAAAIAAAALGFLLTEGTSWHHERLVGDRPSDRPRHPRRRVGAAGGPVASPRLCFWIPWCGTPSSPAGR